MKKKQGTFAKAIKDKIIATGERKLMQLEDINALNCMHQGGTKKAPLNKYQVSENEKIRFELAKQ